MVLFIQILSPEEWSLRNDFIFLSKKLRWGFFDVKAFPKREWFHCKPFAALFNIVLVKKEFLAAQRKQANDHVGRQCNVNT